MNLKLSAVVGTLSALAVGTAPATSRAQDVTLALPTVSLVFSTAYVAEEKGYWKSAGLNVKTVTIAGAGATNALLSESADFSSTGPGPMFRAVAKGQRLTAIALTSDKFLLEIVLRSDVAAKLNVSPTASLADRAKALKGLSLGVDSVNGFPHGYIRYIAGKFGLNAEKDIVISPVQPPTLVPALQAQRIQGFAFSQPWTSQAIQSAGAVRWISNPAGDLPELNPYAYNLYVTRGGYCDNTPATCQKFLRGLKEAQSFIHDHPQEALEIVRKRAAPNLDAALVAQAWETYRASMPRSLEVTQVGMKNAENFSVTAGLLDESERVKNWSEVYNNRFLK
jgi:ABC-type nitrate/sulfonate/bicarbonate transport system substrate-binding protein